MARPTDYGPKILKAAKAYLELCTAEEKLPQIAGLALYLDCARDTLYEWAKVHPEFSDMFEKVLTSQEERLIDGGVTGKFNSTITKLILTKHGYKEESKHEVTLPKPIDDLSKDDGIPQN